MREKRQFPRVDLKNIPEDMKNILGATVSWPWQEVTHVHDVSHNGAALGAPTQQTLEAGQELDLQFRVDGFPKFKVTGVVARAGQHMVGFKFIAMDTQQRVNFERFLQGKIMGLNVRLVNPHFYGSNSPFTYWFHGPHEFNVFIWEQNGQIERAQIEMGTDVLEYVDRSFKIATKEATVGETEPLAKKGAVAALSLQDSLYKALEILSHVQESKELLAPLVRLLLEHQ